MRADRLLAILTLLQSRGRIAAPALADELGVSVRTIYRDIDALCEAGIPIYAETGAGGGYQLVEAYRSTLTGLTSDELHALLLSFPEPLAALDTGATLKTALDKLLAARSRYPARGNPPPVYLDWAWWGQHDSAPHLHRLYEAARDRRRVHIAYRLPNRVEIRRVVEPYGLVAKAGAWYLVYAGGGRLHTQRVSDLADVHLTGEPFERPADFDLEAHWKAVCAEFEIEHLRFRAVVRVAPGLLEDFARMARLLGALSVSEPGTTGADGWTSFEVMFAYFETARAALLGMGGAVDVLAPEALRLSVADFAAQVVARYRP